MTDLELTLCEQILKIEGALTLYEYQGINLSDFSDRISYASLIARRAIATDKLKNCVMPTGSTGICGSVTAGYGHLDGNGYFQFPLRVNQETFEVSGWDEQ